METVTHFFATHTEKQGVVLGGNIEVHQSTPSPLAALAEKYGWEEPTTRATTLAVMATNVGEDVRDIISHLKRLPGDSGRQQVVELLWAIVHDTIDDLRDVDQAYTDYLEDAQLAVDWHGK